jgi:hypothetical protein
MPGRDVEQDVIGGAVIGREHRLQPDRLGGVRRVAALNAHHARRRAILRAGSCEGERSSFSRPGKAAHPVKLPNSLQEHSHPVRFRNVRLREMQPRQPKP